MELVVGAGLLLGAIFVVAPLLERWFKREDDAMMAAVYLVLIVLPLTMVAIGVLI